MSTTLTIVIVVAIAVAIDWWFVRWLAHRRHSRLPTEAIGSVSSADITPPPTHASHPAIQTTSESALTGRETGLALAALAIAAIAQYAMTHGQPIIGMGGYVAALVISGRTLRNVVPQAFAGDSVYHAESRHEPGIGNAQPAPLTLFLKNWRQYTVANLLSGSPPATLTAPVEPVEPSTQEPLPGTAQAPLTEAVPAKDTAPVGALESASRAVPATISSWTGDPSPFVNPQAVVVTSQGDVLVMDAGQEMIYRFDRQGNLLGRWAASGLPETRMSGIAASPDGGTLYVVDAASKSIKVIQLGTGTQH